MGAALSPVFVAASCALFIGGPFASAQAGPSEGPEFATLFEDPAGDWGDQVWVTYVATPAVDILSASVAQDEASLWLRVQLRDLNSPELAAAQFKSFFTFEFVNDTERVVFEAIATWSSSHVQPRLDASFQENGDPFHFKVEATATVSTAESTVTVVVAKETLASHPMFRENGGVKNAMVLAVAGPCYPLNVGSWFCAGGAGQAIGVDLGPQSGTDPVGSAKSFEYYPPALKVDAAVVDQKVEWAPTKAGSGTPAPSVALVVAIFVLVTILRRRPS